MICLIFALTGLLYFALSICVMDALLAFARETEQIEKMLGRDDLIFPDHKPEHEN